MNKAQQQQLAQSAVAQYVIATLGTLDAPVTPVVEVLAVAPVSDAMQSACDAFDSMLASAPVITRARVNVGCKVALRDLFDANDATGTPVRYTLKQLCAMTSKTEVNVRTQLSDMRNAKYAGKHGVYLTDSVRVAGVTMYQRHVAAA